MSEFIETGPAPRSAWSPLLAPPKLSLGDTARLLRLGETVETPITDDMRKRVDRYTEEIVARTRQHYGRSPEKIRDDCRSFYLEEAARQAFGLDPNPFFEALGGTIYTESGRGDYRAAAWDALHAPTHTRLEFKTIGSRADTLKVRDLGQVWAHLLHSDEHPDYLVAARLSVGESVARFKVLYVMPMATIYDYRAGKPTRYLVSRREGAHLVGRVFHREACSDGFGAMTDPGNWSQI